MAAPEEIATCPASGGLLTTSTGRVGGVPWGHGPAILTGSSAMSRVYDGQHEGDP